MTIDQERDYILKHPYYKNSVTWKDRVMRMGDTQVHAIFKNFQKVDYAKLERNLRKREANNKKYHQIDMFEYLREKENEENT